MTNAGQGTCRSARALREAQWKMPTDHTAPPALPSGLCGPAPVPAGTTGPAHEAHANPLLTVALGSCEGPFPKMISGKHAQPYGLRAGDVDWLCGHGRRPERGCGPARPGEATGGQWTAAASRARSPKCLCCSESTEEAERETKKRDEVGTGGARSTGLGSQGAWPRRVPAAG